jgi:hypothetical protein
VERFYISRRYLLPSHHKAYWFGMHVRPGSPQGAFTWLDTTVNVSIAVGAYRNWGVLTLSDGQMVGEPNNMVAPPEACGVCNASQARQGVWGWADANCEMSFTAMCRLLGEQVMRGCAHTALRKQCVLTSNAFPSSTVCKKSLK